MKKIIYFFLSALAFLAFFVSSNTLEVKGHQEVRSGALGSAGDHTTRRYELHWERFWNDLKALPAKTRNVLEPVLKQFRY